MKRSLLAAACLACLSFTIYAQTTETFDIATFRSPKGWTKQAGSDGIQFAAEDKATGAFSLLTLFRSAPSLGDPKEDFAAAWQTIVKEAVTVGSAPQMQPMEDKDGWKIASGYAPFEKDGLKGAAVLVTASGFGKMVNVMILTNTDAYEKDVTAFLASVNLKKPAVQAAPQVPVSRNGSPALTDNFWKAGAVRQGMLGHSGLSTGTFAKTYQFFANGTYKFYREDMQLAAPKYYLEHEEGTYSVSGDTITITPKKASFSQHRLKKEDPPARSGALPLSAGRYRFEFWNYDGNWRLLLSPVDGSETKRDGTFSFYRNGEPQRTYQYHYVDAAGRLIQ